MLDEEKPEEKKDFGSSSALQLSRCLEKLQGQNALLFWAKNMKLLVSLFPVATRILAVLASSAPIEHVFSHVGIILRPRHAQMTDRLLASLVFCKCYSQVEESLESKLPSFLPKICTDFDNFWTANLYIVCCIVFKYSGTT